MKDGPGTAYLASQPIGDLFQRCQNPDGEMFFSPSQACEWMAENRRRPGRISREASCIDDISVPQRLPPVSPRLRLLARHGNYPGSTFPSQHRVATTVKTRYYQAPIRHNPEPKSKWELFKVCTPEASVAST
jgi:hypothetical protein